MDMMPAARHDRLRVLVALFFCALALRPQLVGLAPLLPAIQKDLGISHAVAGLLSTLPVLCMGVFAPLAPLAARRLGTRAGIGASLLAIGLFGIARAIAPPAGLVILLTLGVGLGMGLAGALLQVFVKERLPDQAVRGTGAYAAGIQLGSALSAGGNR